MDQSKNQNDNLPADAAQKNTSALLAEALESELQSYAAELLQTSSPEALHQLRVTLRKIRALAGVGKKHLAEDQRAQIRDHIKWLSDLTSPARDADVQLEHEAKAAIKLPPTARKKMEKQKAESYDRIMQQLRTERFSTFCSLLGSLGSLVAVNGEEDGVTPELMRRRIHRLVKRSMKQGDILDRNSSDEEFHELRKLLKKLRYTLGFLIQNAPEKKLSKAEKYLKQIQDYLGYFQDQTVLAAELKARANELIRSQESDRQELFDIGLQTGKAKENIQHLKTGFPELFRKFSKAMHKYLLEE